MKKVYENIDDFLDDVHNLLSIKDIAIQMGIIERSKMNGDFTNCIFHEEKSPSLQIKENFFKCYSGQCGAKGDMISLITMYYNIDFIEGIKKLADFLNINISNIKMKFDGKTNKIKQEWEDYLKQMNSAPKEIQELKRDYFPQEVGYDHNINYIVLPLTSRTGSILGFTKRRIDFLHQIGEDGKFKFPKWKHSSLSDSLIKQCHNMFNYFTANKEIRKLKEIIITEGPKDVIGYLRIKKPNTVCSCGTQNSNNIWDLLLPVENIVLSMDADAAGIKAAINAILYLSSFFDIQKITSVVLPDKEDPYSVKNLQKYYDERISAASYFIQHATKEQVKELYDTVPEFNKVYLMKEICLQKEFSVSEAESWLLTEETTKVNDKKELSEKEKLLSFINGDSGSEYMPIEKAKRILKMRYGINV